MKIDKVINNNLVRSVDEQNREVLVMGCGLGFQKKTTELIDLQKIEKVYVLQNDVDVQDTDKILEDIPLEELMALNEIVAYGKETLQISFGDRVFLSLADHIHCAVERHKQGIVLSNALLSEIRSFYPREFEIGKMAVNCIQHHTEVSIPEDEAAFIALHFINAGTNGHDMSKTKEMMELISKILSILEFDCQMQIDRESIQYERFVTHLKYFSKRLLNSQFQEEQPDPGLYQMIKSQYKKAYLTSLKIQSLIEKEYSKTLTNNELIYLSIHINRLIQLCDKNKS